MKLESVRKCRRKTIVSELYPSEFSKRSATRYALSTVISGIIDSPTTYNTSNIYDVIGDVFDELDSGVLPKFERDAEVERLGKYITRWVDFEKDENTWELLAKTQTQDVEFAGITHAVRIDAIIRRPQGIEIVKFSNSKPSLTMNARSENTKPANSPSLLLLQLAGEMVVNQLGGNPTSKRIYASQYHLRAKGDSGLVDNELFESKLGQNIISHSFTDEDKSRLESEFLILKPDLDAPCEDEKVCNDCIYSELCKSKFEPLTLAKDEPEPIKEVSELNLTEGQQRFVDSHTGTIRVNAVAGSGKTTVVTLRTLALLKAGTSPSGILMLTFTDKAKDEMKSRLKAYAASPLFKDANIDTKEVRIETFNSWGQSFIEDWFCQLGFTQAPSLIDDITKKDIVSDLVGLARELMPNNEMGLNFNTPFLNMPNAKGAVTTMVSVLDQLKCFNVATANDVARIYPKFADVARDILFLYNEYNKELMARNLIDYEDQLRLLITLQSKGYFSFIDYEHLVIDEFQDSNKNQIDIIVSMSKACKNLKSLVVVGDELQAIYGFRNATPENLIEFGSHFPDLVDIPLADNFRSETPIIKLANNIISKISTLGTNIIAHKTASSAKPHVVSLSSDDEIDLFVRQTKKLIGNGVEPKDIALLARNKNELYTYQAALTSAGVASILRVPKVMIDSPYVQAIVSLAHFISRGITVADKDLALFAKSKGIDPFDKMAVETLGNSIIPDFSAGFPDEYKYVVFNNIVAHCKEDYVADGFLSMLAKKGFTTFDEMLEYCAKYRAYETKDTMSAAKERSDSVSLITIHSAKGLEWDTVLLSTKKFKDNAEEYRLLYVAVTRAKQRLLVSNSNKVSDKYLSLLDTGVC